MERQITWYVGIVKMGEGYESFYVRNGGEDNFYKRKYSNEGEIVAEVVGVSDFAFNGRLAKTERRLFDIAYYLGEGEIFNAQKELEKIFELED